MILGMSVAMFTTVHVTLSLIGIVAGLIVLFGMIEGRQFGSWAAAFLTLTVLTSVTGFPIPPFGLDPPCILGILSLLLLAFAILPLYAFRLGVSWRWLCVARASPVFYLNFFFGMVLAC